VRTRFSCQFRTQVGEKGLNLGNAHPSAGSGHRFGGVTHAVEMDVAFDPTDVGLLGAKKAVCESDGIPSASSPRLRSGQAGKARTWSSSFLSVGSIVSLQNDLPFCEFSDMISSPGNHNKILRKRSSKGTQRRDLAMATNWLFWAMAKDTVKWPRLWHAQSASPGPERRTSEWTLHPQ